MSGESHTLAQTDFELFGLPERFAQVRTDIDGRWKALQQLAHPDQFATQGAAAQRAAAQLSARINQAHSRLRDPLARAAYLCELRGAPVDAENNAAMPPAFLMVQMEWREALADAENGNDIQKIEEIGTLSNNHGQSLLQKIEQLLDGTSKSFGASFKVETMAATGETENAAAATATRVDGEPQSRLQNTQAASALVRQWLFIDKFNIDLGKALDRLGA